MTDNGGYPDRCPWCNIDLGPYTDEQGRTWQPTFHWCDKSGLPEPNNLVDVAIQTIIAREQAT